MSASASANANVTGNNMNGLENNATDPARRPTSYSRSHSRSPSRSLSRSISRSPRGRSSTRRSYSRSPSSYAKSYDSRGDGKRRSPAPSSSFSRREPKRMPSPARPNNVIGVFGLSIYTKERTIEDIYKEFGRIEHVDLVRDKRTGMSRGFAFIYYDEISSAEVAKEKTNGMDLDGRQLRVDFSKTTGPHTPTPGQYMGRPRDSLPPRRYGGGSSSSGSYYSHRERERERDRYHSRSRSRSPPRRSRRSPSPRGRYYERRSYSTRSVSRSR